jgi:hypothetical protein
VAKKRSKRKKKRLVRRIVNMRYLHFVAPTRVIGAEETVERDWFDEGWPE